MNLKLIKTSFLPSEKLTLKVNLYTQYYIKTMELFHFFFFSYHIKIALTYLNLSSYKINIIKF